MEKVWHQPGPHCNANRMLPKNCIEITLTEVF